MRPKSRVKPWAQSGSIRAPSTAARLVIAERADARIGELAANIHAATAQLVDAIAEFNAVEGWGSWGASSPQHYLSWRTGLSMGSARKLVELAHYLEDLPRVRTAFGRAELSADKAHAIAKVADPATEETLVELGYLAPVFELMRLTRAYARVVENTTFDAKVAHERRYLDYFFDSDRSFVIKGRLSTDDGAVVKKALDTASDELRELCAPETPIDYLSDSQARADALVAVCDSALADGLKDHSGADKYQVMVHVSADALPKQRGDDIPGEVCDIDEVGIASETARRITCDASIVPLIVSGDGEVLSIGRKRRAVPTGLRRALRHRDKRCRYPGCPNDRFVDAHHVEHWGHGGETLLDNLLTLCRRHHRLLHEGGYSVTFEAGEAVFRAAAGWVIKPVPDLPAPVDLMVANRATGVNIDPEHALPPSEVGQMDYDMAVSGLLSDLERGAQEQVDPPGPEPPDV